MKIGVLALQGGFSRHIAMLEKIGVSSLEVRNSSDLSECDGLILPGGESTTMSSLLQEEDFLSSLKDFAAHHPLFGTCAGMILMAKHCWLQIAVTRNAYGRQAASFTTTLSLPTGDPIEAVFIRAPRIKAILSPSVEILATYQGSPVLIKQGAHIGAAFHPELTENPALHSFFIQSIIMEKGG